MIASDAEAAKNQLTTGTLSASDLENRERYLWNLNSLSWPDQTRKR